MLANYFEIIKRHGVPVSFREYLDFLGCLKHRVIGMDVEEFYYLSRACMAKDERYFDRFDRGFKAFRDGMETLDQLVEALIPEEWLSKQFEANISEEDLKKIKSFDGLDKLIEEFKKRLEEQKKRHQGATVDWYRRYLTVWSRREKHKGRHSCRRQGRAAARQQNLGAPRVSQSRRQRRNRHPQYQGGA